VITFCVHPVEALLRTKNYWAIPLALILGFACTPADQTADEDTTDAQEEAPAQTFSLRLPRWAQRNANIRTARSANSELAASLQRGERIEVSGASNGWVEVYREGRAIGFVAQSMLRSSPLPEKEFQMRDVGFRVSDEGESAWTYTWTLNLENTGLTNYPSLEAELKFVDGRSRLIASDTAFGISLSPGERRVFTGTVAVLLPLGSSIRNVGAEIRETGN
jgi:hypothetical protein